MKLTFIVLWFILSSLCTGVTCSSSEPEHLGCFASQPVQDSRNYKVTQALIWKDGLNVCNHRLTIYMAVQFEQGFQEDNFFYCGNDLLNILYEVDNSTCQPCVHNQEIMCGGPGTVSLYKLRDQTPLTVLLGTSSTGIIKVLEGSSGYTVQVKGDGYAVLDLDFNMVEDELVYGTSGRVLYRSRYNYKTHSYGNKSMIVSRSKTIHDIAINWMNDEVYWSYYNGEGIYVVDQYGVNSLRVDRPSDQYDLTVDPLTSNLFFVESNYKLHSYSLSTNSSKEFVKFGRLYMTSNKYISVDVHKKMVYVIGKIVDDSSYHLVQVDYEDSTAKDLYAGAAISENIRSLDVFNNIAVWINYESGQLVVYSCKLTPKCREVKELHRSTEDLHDVKIFHPDRQKSPVIAAPKKQSHTEKFEVTLPLMEKSLNKKFESTPGPEDISKYNSSMMKPIYATVFTPPPPETREYENNSNGIAKTNFLVQDNHILYCIIIGGTIAVVASVYVAYIKLKLSISDALVTANNVPMELKRMNCEHNYEVVKHEKVPTGLLIE